VTGRATRIGWFPYYSGLQDGARLKPSWAGFSMTKTRRRETSCILSRINDLSPSETLQAHRAHAILTLQPNPVRQKSFFSVTPCSLVDKLFSRENMGFRGRGNVGTELQAGRAWVLFPMRSLDFSSDLILPASDIIEYQESS
jgi:hypothetical protein